jgi:2-keto-4-pentenoate hydratase/2-oxohepta-3-ene-1,7-dioic acid hydratase in catechol pathway
MYSIEAAAANRLGNDWLIGKSRDTFAPLGPFVVPKEFVPNARNMSMRFALNAETLQEGNTSQMIHDACSNSPRTAATS